MTVRWLASDVGVATAPNPGPMTLDGTNSYLLGRPGGGLLVVDPGPAPPGPLGSVAAGHHAALLAAGTVTAVLLTHRHLDHAESAAMLAAAAGCGVRAVDPVWRVGPAGLADGDVLAAGDLRVRVVAVPGHTADSVALLVNTGDGSVRLLTGDTVLGRGTAVVSTPDGDLRAYLDSLERLRRLVLAEDVAALLPGHGPVRTDPDAVLAGYLAHRRERLTQVQAALRAGASTVVQVVDRVYGDLEPALRPAAEQSVRAQLDYLRAE